MCSVGSDVVFVSTLDLVDVDGGDRVGRFIVFRSERFSPDAVMARLYVVLVTSFGVS